MALKITKRRNGLQMTTISVKHNVSRETVLQTIVDTLWHDGTPAEEQNELTRAGIEVKVRESFARQGSDWEMEVFDHLDDMADDEVEEAREWADSELQRLWPEWS